MAALDGEVGVAAAQRLVDRRVDAADEEAGDRGDAGHVPSGLGPPLQPGHVRLGHPPPHRPREEEGDVDVDALGDERRDRLQPGLRRRHLDHQVVARDQRPEAPPLRDRAGRVVRELGRHLEAHIAVDGVAFLVDGAEDVAGRADVLDHDRLGDAVGIGPGHGGDDRVIRPARLDRALEDRRVRRHAAQARADQGHKRPVRVGVAGDMVEPDRLALFGMDAGERIGHGGGSGFHTGDGLGV